MIKLIHFSESFIREFQNKVDWGYVSRFQILSESFIEEFKDKVVLVYDKNTPNT